MYIRWVLNGLLVTQSPWKSGAEKTQKRGNKENFRWTYSRNFFFNLKCSDILKACNLSYMVSWLQVSLLDLWRVKLYLAPNQPVSNSLVRNFIPLEPVPWFYANKVHEVPLVPFNTKIFRKIDFCHFQHLLKKLGYVHQLLVLKKLMNIMIQINNVAKKISNSNKSNQPGSIRNCHAAWPSWKQGSVSRVSWGDPGLLRMDLKKTEGVKTTSCL